MPKGFGTRGGVGEKRGDIQNLWGPAQTKSNGQAADITPKKKRPAGGPVFLLSGKSPESTRFTGPRLAKGKQTGGLGKVWEDRGFPTKKKQKKKPKPR